jgi:hypothetical protein
MPDVIIISCCLHNMCNQLKDVDEDVHAEEVEDDAGEEDENCDERGTAAGKRQIISYLLM